MPINIPDQLPAAKVLSDENVFFKTHASAAHQDIRPLEIAILNLMPDKITTEVQLLRLLGNTPLQVQITLLHPQSYQSKNTPPEHLFSFYKHFADVADRKFDGLIITGAPVEHLAFEEVTYWPELAQIMDWSLTHVTSTLHICWAAQAGLYHHFGVPKHPLPQKMFGVFPHRVCSPKTPLLRGFDETFFVPHSRHTCTRADDIAKIPALEILAESATAGVYAISARGGRQFFITGHSEYDPTTLQKEYTRDLAKGLPIQIPQNYFPHDDPTNTPISTWRSHAHLLFANWLNYYVYQETPYNLELIS